MKPFSLPISPTASDFPFKNNHSLKLIQDLTQNNDSKKSFNHSSLLKFLSEFMHFKHSKTLEFTQLSIETIQLF